MGVHPGASVREVPEGDPGEPDGERGTDDSEEADEHEIEDDIEHETDDEDFHPFVDAPDPREDLEVDLEEEIEHDEERGILEDDPGHRELIPEEDACDERTEHEHEHARDDSEHGEVLVEEGLDDSDFPFVSLSVELRYDREYESDDGRDNDEGDSDDAQVVGVVSGVPRPEEVDDELHVHLSEYRPDIGSEYYPEGVLNNLSDQLFIVDNLRVLEIGEIVRLVHEKWSENDPNHHSANPGPRVGDERPPIHRVESECEEHHEYHPQEFRSFLELGVLTHSKDGHIHIVDIEPQKEQAEYLNDADRFAWVKVVFRKISGGEKQYESYNEACDKLGDKWICYQRFESCPVLLYYELGQEKIETLRESEIVVGGKKGHETENSVQEPDFLDREVPREDDLHNIPERSDQKREQIKPKAPADEFFRERFGVVEHERVVRD